MSALARNLHKLGPEALSRLRTYDDEHWLDMLRTLYSNTLLVATLLADALPEYRRLSDQVASTDLTTPPLSQLLEWQAAATPRLWGFASSTLVTTRHEQLINALLDTEHNPGRVWVLHQELAESYALLFGMPDRISRPFELDEMRTDLLTASLLDRLMDKPGVRQWITDNSPDREHRREWLSTHIGGRLYEIRSTLAQI
jgi:hypothetical protein